MVYGSSDVIQSGGELRDCPQKCRFLVEGLKDGLCMPAGGLLENFDNVSVTTKQSRPAVTACTVLATLDP